MRWERFSAARRGLRIGLGALVCVSSALVLTTGTAHAAGSETSFSYVSAAGDYIGQGGAQSYTAPPASIAIASGSTAGALRVSVTSGSDWWYVTLGAPPGSQLSPGQYFGAQRAPFQTAGHAGLDISGNGRGCNQVFGQFSLRSISADAFGNIVELDASFIQHCETSTAPALSGTIRVGAPVSTGVALVSTNPTTVTGEPLVLAASVALGTGNAPTGTVTFKEGTTTLGSGTVDAGGVATLGLGSMAAGSHTIVASYSGDATHPAATSDPITQTVSPNTTSYWFASSGGDWIGQGATAGYGPQWSTMGISGTAAYVTVTVTAADGTWTIDLAAAPGALLQPGAYYGAERAPFRTAGHPGLSVTGHGRGCNTVGGSFIINRIGTDGAGNVNLLDASFSHFCEQASAVPLQGVVHHLAPAAPSTAVTATPSTVSVGEVVALRATVTGTNGAPSGAVTFTDGTTVLGTTTLDAGGTAQLATSSLAVGPHTITATYGGNPDYQPGSASTTVTVQRWSTTTGLSASTTAPKRAKPVTLTATVATAGPAPSGTVTFVDGTTAIGTATVGADRTATLTTSFATNGNHSVTAVYGGDATHLTSTSAAVVLKVR